MATTQLNGKTLQELSTFTHRIKITDADLTEGTDNTNQSVTLFNVKAGQQIRNFAYKVVTAFTEIDASTNPVASLTMKVGEGSGAEFSAAASVLDDATPILYGPTADQASIGKVYTSDTDIKATFDPDSGGALDEVQNGVIEFYFNVVDIDDTQRESNL